MALSVLYAPQDATALPAVDIVAVHGLGGDAIDTWTHPKSKAFWLKDFLPRKFPDARIMTFGYNADVAFGKSTAEIVDHAKSLLASLVDKREEPEEAKRPLIFIAHSLGGIVVKQALLQARLEPLYESIKTATLGVIFLGTPHRGSDKASYGKVLANVAQFVSRRPPQRLVSALQTNSDVLLRLTSDFRFQLPDYQVYSFFELQPMKGLSSLIVEKHSALLETAHEEQIPVDADHTSMCKFDKEDDPTFEKVYKRVKRMTKNPQPANNNPASKNTYFDVPHLLSPVFTGRDEDLRCLAASFVTTSPSQAGSQRRFVLFGLGGSGKTQICLKYIQDQRERYWGVFWVDASTDENIQRSFTQLARMLQVGENVDNVKRTLANSLEAWLLVFDNADDPELSFAPYLPAGNRGDIIFTSRNPQCQHYNTVGYREVGRLSLPDSILLLDKTIHGTVNPSEEATDTSKTIVETLGRLALAIVQAGAYIRETACSHREYLEIYQSCKKDLLLRHPTHVGTDYQYSVYTTWQVSIDMIEARRDRVGHHTLRLLDLLGFYHNEQIPVQMFYHARDRSRMDWIPEGVPWHDMISDFSQYRQAVQASVALLASFSLITRNADASVSLHLLVHEWCRDRQSDEERQLNYRRALSLLTSSVKWEFASEDYTFRRSLVSHVQELLRRWDSESALSEEEKIEDWPVLALILAENGWTKDALLLTEENVELRKNNFGADHPNILSSMNSLAIQYSEAGRQEEALKLAEEVVILSKSKLGADHPDTLSSMNNLAIQYSEAGRQEEALKLAEEVVILQKSKLGADHPNTLSSMNNLASRYSEAGRQEEALKLVEEVAILRKSKLGADHPDTLSSMNNLAIQYSEAGRQEEALKLAEEVVMLRKSKLGADHPDTLSSMNNLASRYSESGRQEEALKLVEEVVILRKSKLGADHPDTLSSMNNLANRYSETGQQEEALKLAEVVVRVRKSKLGADHPDTLTSMNNLAIHYSEAGRQGEALQMTEEVVKLRKSKLRADHPDTLESERLLSLLSHTPEKTSSTPEKTSSIPEKTSSIPEKTSSIPEKTSSTPDNTSSIQETTYRPRHARIKLPRWFRSRKR